MPWREGIGTPFNVSSSGVSENHTTEEFSSDQQVEGLEDILREIDNIGNAISDGGNIDVTSDIERRTSDLGSWDQVDPPDIADDVSGSDAASRHSISDFFSRHVPSDPVSEAPLQSSGAFSRIVAHSIVGQTSANIPAMPWESGPMRSIFMGDEFNPESLMVPIQNSFHCSEVESRDVIESLPSVVGAIATTQPSDVSLTSRSTANLKDKDFFERQAELKQLAVDTWLSILKNHALSSEVGQQILSQCNFDNIEESRSIISAVIGTRSSTTAISRANAILRYLRWASEQGDELNPQSEGAGWSYAKFLEQTGAAATAGSSWLSAVRYSVYIFGYKSMECICNSRRIQGKCDVMYVEKDDLNQAAPFTVSQVKDLHHKLVDSNIDVYDRAFIAFILTAIYTRSRHSDLRLVSKVILDVDESGGFLEIRTRHHKSARNALKKTVLLPIIAPARGVDGSIWVHDVAKAFADVGAQTVSGNMRASQGRRVRRRPRPESDDVVRPSQNPPPTRESEQHMRASQSRAASHPPENDQK